MNSAFERYIATSNTSKSDIIFEVCEDGLHDSALD